MIALDEEYDQVVSLIAGDRQVVKGPLGDPLTLVTLADHPGAEIVINRTRSMGLLASAHSTTQLLTHPTLKPDLVVSLGIAGRVDSDLQLGDLVIPNVVDHYLHQGKLTDRARPDHDNQTRDDDAGEIDFVFSGESYSLDRDLEKVIRTYYADRAKHEAVPLRIKELAFQFDLDLARESLRPHCWLSRDPVASGDLVNTSREFRRQLTRGHDRKIAAIEMEAAGVASVCHAYYTPWLVIRGISDYADGQKAEVERQWRAAATFSCGMVLNELIPALVAHLREGQREDLRPLQMPLATSAPDLSVVTELRLRDEDLAGALSSVMAILVQLPTGGRATLRRASRRQVRWRVTDVQDMPEDPAEIERSITDHLMNCRAILMEGSRARPTSWRWGLRDSALVADAWAMPRIDAPVAKREDVLDGSLPMSAIRRRYFGAEADISTIAAGHETVFRWWRQARDLCDWWANVRPMEGES